MKLWRHTMRPRPGSRRFRLLVSLQIAIVIAAAGAGELAAVQWTPLDDELAAELEADYYGVLRAEGRLKTPTDDGIAPEPRSGRDTPIPVDPYLRDPRGTTVGQTTVEALILVCKTYMRTAGALADQFESILTGGVADKRERLADIKTASDELAELDRKARELEAEYRSALRGASGVRGGMTPQEIEAMTANLETLRESSAAAGSAFLARREELAAQHPELAVEVDGVPLWHALAGLDTYLEQIDVYNTFLRAGRDGMRAQVEDCDQTVAELWEYGSAGYQRTRDAIRQMGEDAGAQLPGQLMDELEGVYEGYETHEKVDQGWRDVVMATAGALLVPLGPAVCAGYGVIEIVKEGSEVIVSYHSLEEARARAPIEGYRHVITEEERLAGEALEAVFTVVTVAPDFLDGVKSVRIVGGAEDACPPRLPSGADDAADAPPATGGAGAVDEGAEAADADAPPATGGDGAVGEVTEQLDPLDLPPEPLPEPTGARPMEEVADDPNYLDTGNPRSLTEDAVDDLEDAMDRAREAGVPESEIQNAAGDVNRNSGNDLKEATERVEELFLARTGCIVVENAPLKELAEVYTRTKNNGGAFHPEHYDWLRRQVEAYPNFFDLLPDVIYKGEPLMNREAAREMEQWLAAGRVRMPREGDLPAFGWTKPCQESDLPPIVEWELYLKDEADGKVRTGGNAAGAPAGRPGPEAPSPGAAPEPEPPVDMDGVTVTGDDPPPPAGGAGAGRVTEQLDPPDLPPAADEVGNVTEQLDPPDLPPAADEAAEAAAETGEAAAETGEAAADIPSGSGAAGSAVKAAVGSAKAAAELKKAEALGEEQPATETGAADAPTVEIVTGFYDLTETIDPIDIELTPFDEPKDPRPVTGVDPDTPTTGAVDSPTGGAPTGGDPAGEPPAGDPPTGDPSADDDPPGDEAGEPPGGDAPANDDIADVFGDSLSLNDVDAADLLNSPITFGFKPDPAVQVMIIKSFYLEVPPSPDSSGAGDAPAPGARTGGPSMPPDLPWTLELPDGPELEAIITSLGSSSGEAFNLVMLNGGSRALQLSGDGLVVEPLQLTDRAKRELEARLTDLAARNPVTMTLTGYCLEFLRNPPAAGQLFRIASRELQGKFASVRRLMRAADRIRAADLLNPDSDPAGYLDSITQWAIWSVEQDLDLKGFETNFIEHTKKNLAAAGQQWTPDIEQLIRRVVPNRWNDIQQVLAEAERLASDARSG